jgi:hypothetical protein
VEAEKLPDLASARASHPGDLSYDFYQVLMKSAFMQIGTGCERLKAAAGFLRKPLEAGGKSRPYACFDALIALMG